MARKRKSLPDKRLRLTRPEASPHLVEVGESAEGTAARANPTVRRSLRPQVLGPSLPRLLPLRLQERGDPVGLSRNELERAFEVLASRAQRPGIEAARQPFDADGAALVRDQAVLRADPLVP